MVGCPRGSLLPIKFQTIPHHTYCPLVSGDRAPKRYATANPACCGLLCKVYQTFQRKPSACDLCNRLLREQIRERRGEVRGRSKRKWTLTFLLILGVLPALPRLGRVLPLTAVVPASALLLGPLVLLPEGPLESLLLTISLSLERGWPCRCRCRGSPVVPAIAWSTNYPGKLEIRE